MGWLRAVASSVRWRIKMSKAAGPSQAMFARAMKDHASRPYSVTTSDRFVCSTSEQAPTMSVGGGKATEESVISQGVFFLFLFYPSALSKYATTLNLNTLLNDMANDSQLYQWTLCALDQQQTGSSLPMYCMTRGPGVSQNASLSPIIVGQLYNNLIDQNLAQTIRKKYVVPNIKKRFGNTTQVSVLLYTLAATKDKQE